MNENYIQIRRNLEILPFNMVLIKVNNFQQSIELTAILQKYTILKNIVSNYGGYSVIITKHFNTFYPFYMYRTGSIEELKNNNDFILCDTILDMNNSAYVKHFLDTLLILKPSYEPKKIIKTLDLK
jgi:hypothetical protein